MTFQNLSRSRRFRVQYSRKPGGVRSGGGADSPGARGRRGASTRGPAASRPTRRPTPRSPECVSRGHNEKANMAHLCVGIYDFLRNIVLSTQLREMLLNFWRIAVRARKKEPLDFHGSESIRSKMAVRVGMRRCWPRAFPAAWRPQRLDAGLRRNVT